MIFMVDFGKIRTIPIRTRENKFKIEDAIPIPGKKLSKNKDIEKVKRYIGWRLKKEGGGNILMENSLGSMREIDFLFARFVT